MGLFDYVLLLTAIVGVIVFGLFMLNRWASKKYGAQRDMIEKSKQTVSIYVIDKKKTKAADSNLPKAVVESLPRLYKMMKMPMVKAKIGPQIMTLICDKKVYEALPVKKNVKVELAGLYIVEMKGMKSAKEMKDIQNSRKKNKEK